MNIDIIQQGKQARQASKTLLRLETSDKNKALASIAQILRTHQDEIIVANKKDLKLAYEHGISEVMMDRLTLNPQRIDHMAITVEKVMRQEDPIGQICSGKRLPNGLKLLQERVPLGVVGVIYESRPNVTIDAAVLCLKTSNAVLLRGGKEAFYTNSLLVELIQQALSQQHLPLSSVELVKDSSRETAIKMMQMHEYLDVLIPRGGTGLIQTVLQEAMIPVIETGTGNCHIYVDSQADLSMAVDIIYNAKCSRPSVCNACESVVLHQDIASMILPMLSQRFSISPTVEIRGCHRTKKLLPHCTLATEQDYATEFLDYILSIQVVDHLQEAIAHINHYSTNHSEAIITKSLKRAQLFTSLVDAAAVYVNASTRFTDGEEFGLGAEVGISTQKLHARGPMGLTALTTTKYVLYGDGQIR